MDGSPNSTPSFGKHVGKIFLGKSGTLRLTGRLLRQSVAGELSRILLGLLFLLMASGATLLQPWPLKFILDNVVGTHPPMELLGRISEAFARFFGLTENPKYSLLLLICVAVLAIEGMIGIFKVSSNYMLVSAGERMVFKFRCRLFNHLQRLSLAYHKSTPTGDSMYRVTSDTNSVAMILNDGLIPAVTAMLTLMGIAYVMLTRDLVLTFAALSVGLPLVLMIRGLDGIMSKRSLDVHKRESDINVQVQETLSSIDEVQAFTREQYEGERFRHRANASMKANLKFNMVEAGSQAGVDLLLAAGIAMVVWIATSRVLEGHLTAGDVVLMVSYVWMLYEPLETIAYTAANIQGATAGARRVYEILDTLPDVADDEKAVDLIGNVDGKIVIKDVSFRYKEGQTVLSNINLDIPAGTAVIITGHSGAGKTTLISLILRFYDPTSGSVSLDGHDIRTFTLESVRRNIALVPQEPILLDASVRENIAYGKPEATMDEIISAARAAVAHEFIGALPEQYETRIGAKGNHLSKGQKQRIAIARAILKDAAILIFDEPTSSLDSDAEDLLIRTLEGLIKGRTTIIVSHKISIFHVADMVIEIKDGKLVEPTCLV